MALRLMVIGLILGLPVARLAAQERQLGLHLNFLAGSSSHDRGFGGGVEGRTTFGKPTHLARLSLSPRLDVVKQEGGGPTTTTIGLDGTVQPGGNSRWTPYAGAGVGVNWSAGHVREWTGARPGADVLGGFTVRLSDLVTIRAEQRFGYVQHAEHVLITRAGVLLAF